jgi:hypothetical protein
MNEFSLQQFDAFFASISAWRAAYRRARLHFLAIRNEEGLSIISARIYMDAGGADGVKPHFKASAIEAWQWDVPQDSLSVEALVQALIADSGFSIEGIGRLRFESNEQNEVFVSPPTLLHPEGLTDGNRLAVLGVAGLNWIARVPQPETDWLLKAADAPYDSLQELCNDFGLGVLSGDRSLLEVVARTAVEVLVRSEVQGTAATLGVWMASSLDRNKAKIGYRVLDRGKVLLRGAFAGVGLNWYDENQSSVGIAELQIPLGAHVQCIASYDGHAHQVQWRADPDVFQNPRAAVFSLVDPSQKVMRAYLRPDQPPRGAAADDFETAVGWLLWMLGFSTVSFGTNAKTREAFDIVGVSPNGNFLVVECTLGLLRADSKLSRLTSRAASLRQALDASNMKHLRVLPVVVTALGAEQVKADMGLAEEVGILVITKEHLDRTSDELLRFPDADRFFEQAMSSVTQRQISRSGADRGVSGA